MFQVEDDPQAQEPMETYHLYVVREGQRRLSLVPVLISILTLSFLIAIGIVTPFQQPETRTLIRVPAALLPLKTFSTSITVIPTGIKTYPATTAHGILTITNGSILAETLPKGMILTGKDGAEVITDQTVFVPAGSATGLGIAYVSAHAARAGAAGNISSLDINSVDGTALFIRNLAAFTGGQDSYTVTFIRPQDREEALSQARSILLPQTLNGLVESPCIEIVTGNQTLHVSWICQFVSYSTPDLPGMKVLHAEVKGKTILLEVVYVERPRILTTK